MQARREDWWVVAAVALVLLTVWCAGSRPRRVVHELPPAPVALPLPTEEPEAQEILIEVELPEPPCEGLSDRASLLCVLAYPADDDMLASKWSLEPFSQRTLVKAERAARQQRLLEEA